MKKFEYKMSFLDNETIWEESGVQKSGWTGGATNLPGDLKFANE